jgi:hypothetical protein
MPRPRRDHADFDSLSLEPVAARSAIGPGGRRQGPLLERPASRNGYRTALPAGLVFHSAYSLSLALLPLAAVAVELAGVIVDPHDRQKRAPGFTARAQFGQGTEAGSEVPHPRQNCADPELAAPQELQSAWESGLSCVIWAESSRPPSRCAARRAYFTFCLLFPF